ncbi:MAG TPA: hypothetical protein VGW80_12290, partial [Solirubrobacterales bacterium]|nr:hypothetical protein [Solirubrobacterales bacterium]
MTRLAIVALTALLTLAAPAAAQVGTQQSLVGEAAQALRTSPVYVDPDAEHAISPREEAALERQIADAGAGPMYVAIVPDAAADEAGGSAEGVARAIANELRRPGTYAVVAGDRFRAASTVLQRGEAARIATDAFEVRGDEGVYATLREFAERVGEARRNGGEAPSEGPGAGGFGGLGLLALLGAAVDRPVRTGVVGMRGRAVAPSFALAAAR